MSKFDYKQYRLSAQDKEKLISFIQKAEELPTEKTFEHSLGILAYLRDEEMRQEGFKKNVFEEYVPLKPTKTWEQEKAEMDEALRIRSEFGAPDWTGECFSPICSLPLLTKSGKPSKLKRKFRWTLGYYEWKDKTIVCADCGYAYRMKNLKVEIEPAEEFQNKVEEEIQKISRNYD